MSFKWDDLKAEILRQEVRELEDIQRSGNLDRMQLDKLSALQWQLLDLEEAADAKAMKKDPKAELSEAVQMELSSIQEKLGFQVREEDKPALALLGHAVAIDFQERHAMELLRSRAASASLKRMEALTRFNKIVQRTEFAKQEWESRRSDLVARKQLMSLYEAQKTMRAPSSSQLFISIMRTKFWLSSAMRRAYTVAWIGLRTLPK